MIQLLPPETQKAYAARSTAEARAKQKRRTTLKMLAIILVVVVGLFVVGTTLYALRARLAPLTGSVRSTIARLVGVNEQVATPTTPDGGTVVPTLTPDQLQKILVDAKLSRSIDEKTGVATDAVDAFGIADTRYYLVVELTSLPPAFTAEVRWYKDDEFQANYKLLPSSRFATFWIDVATRPEAERAGNYRAEISFNSTLVKTLTFVVQ